VTRLAATLGVVAPQHVLAADWLHEAWEPERVKELLGSFSPGGGSYRIDLLTTAFKELKGQLLDGSLPKLEEGGGSKGAAPAAAASGGAAAAPAVFTEPWFGMEAIALPLPDALTAAWAAAPPAPELALPPRNPYIPSDFSLCCDAGTDGATAAAAAGAAGPADAEAEALAAAEGLPVVLATPPVLVLDEPGGGPWRWGVGWGLDGRGAGVNRCQWIVGGPGRGRSAAIPVLNSAPDPATRRPGLKLWHKVDRRFRQPRAHCYVRLSSAGGYGSPRAAALTALWLKLVEDALNEDAYMADVAGGRGLKVWD
jgi:hypothetical protein